jgi:hypothetical protein
MTPFGSRSVLEGGNSWSLFRRTRACAAAIPGVFIFRVMQPARTKKPQELQALQERLRALLRANMGEARRTRELLRDTEQKVEEQLGHLDFIETSWYITGKKFRKEPVRDIAPRL